MTGTETFFTLLHNAAHWEFELFLMAVFDGLVGALLWPRVKRHFHQDDEDTLRAAARLHGDDLGPYTDESSLEEILADLRVRDGRYQPRDFDEAEGLQLWDGRTLDLSLLKGAAYRKYVIAGLSRSTMERETDLGWVPLSKEMANDLTEWEDLKRRYAEEFGQRRGAERRGPQMPTWEELEDLFQ